MRVKMVHARVRDWMIVRARRETPDEVLSTHNLAIAAQRLLDSLNRRTGRVYELQVNLRLNGLGWRTPTSGFIRDPAKLETLKLEEGGTDYEQLEYEDDNEEHLVFEQADLLLRVVHPREGGCVGENNRLNDCLSWALTKAFAGHVPQIHNLTLEMKRELGGDTLAHNSVLKTWCGLPYNARVPASMIPRVEEAFAPSTAICLVGNEGETYHSPRLPTATRVIYLRLKRNKNGEGHYVVATQPGRTTTPLRVDPSGKPKQRAAYLRREAGGVVTWDLYTYESLRNGDEPHATASTEQLHEWLQRPTVCPYNITPMTATTVDELRANMDTIREYEESCPTSLGYDLRKYPSLKTYLRDVFRGMSRTVTASPELEPVEVDWLLGFTSVESGAVYRLRSPFRGGVMFWEAYEGVGFDYDIVSMYPSLYKTKCRLPNCKPTPEVLPADHFVRCRTATMGFYRCTIRVTGPGERLWRSSSSARESIYTHTDIMTAKMLGELVDPTTGDKGSCTITLHNGGQTNALIYRGAFVTFEQAFGGYMNAFWPLKLLGNPLGKIALNRLWGMQGQTRKKKKVLDGDDRISQDELGGDVIAFHCEGEKELYTVRGRGVDAFMGDYPRWPAFITALARQRLMKLLTDNGKDASYLATIKRINTDGWVSSVELPERLQSQIGINPGQIKHVRHYDHDGGELTCTTINKLRKPSWN
ncbi:TPA_asm: PolB [Monosiga MELD virus 1]|nr:TPA_asm: PolB [Monosiga MELD virus 1]